MQFGLRWLLLLTFLVAAWAALVFNYESFLGPKGRFKAFMLASNTLTAAVVQIAVSVVPPVARFQQLMWRPLSAADYEYLTRRLTWCAGGLVCCLLPLGAVVHFDSLVAEQLTEMSRGIAVAIVMAIGTALWLLLVSAVGLLVLAVKAARWQCPACGRRFTRFSGWRRTTTCANCQRTLKELNPINQSGQDTLFRTADLFNSESCPR